METRISVRDWQEIFEAGMYEGKSVYTQCEAGWYDWFCDDVHLARKTKRMGEIITQIRDGGKVNLDTSYVWFKNNFPMRGNLYDDFRFADIETNEVLFTITLGAPYHDERYAVYCEGHWEEPAFKANTTSELIAWLNAA